jgi:hypothetical protein
MRTWCAAYDQCGRFGTDADDCLIDSASQGRVSRMHRRMLALVAVVVAVALHIGAVRVSHGKVTARREQTR